MARTSPTWEQERWRSAHVCEEGRRLRGPAKQVELTTSLRGEVRPSRRAYVPFSSHVRCREMDSPRVLLVPALRVSPSGSSTAELVLIVQRGDHLGSEHGRGSRGQRVRRQLGSVTYTPSYPQMDVLTEHDFLESRRL